jgi:cytochrome c-type biogenesis protein CcmH
MLVWFVMALLTGATVIAVIRPLSRSIDASPETATDKAFYTAQIVEIDRDAARGLIGPEEAEAARAEAARRLLTAAREAENAGRSTAFRIRFAALVAVILVPALTLGLYLRIGSPDEPDRPLEARLRQAPDFAVLVAKVEKRLAEQPDDAAGWQVIAPVYVQAGRYDDAERAYLQIIRLKGPDVDRLTSLGEVRVMQAGGVVTAEARETFAAALKIDPKAAAARFYTGLAYEQEGRTADAVGIFTALLADLPADTEAAAAVSSRIAALAPGSVPAGGEAVAALPEAERAATIRAMVDGLDQRLRSEGGTADAWARLIRAFAVLKEGEKARDALTRARLALSADAEAIRTVEAAARAAGVE